MEISSIPDDPDEAARLGLLLLSILSSFSFYIVTAFCLLGLLACSGLISASEIALFSLSKLEIKKCRALEKRCDRHLCQLLTQPQRLLATILILNNVVNVAFVTLSTFIAWRVVGTHDLVGWMITILTAVVTFAIVFFGEIIPKVYASQHALRYARLVSSPLYYVNAFFLPLTSIFEWINVQLQRRVRSKGYSYSIDALHQALDIATRSQNKQEKDNISKEEEEILRGIMHLSSIPVKDIMQPRHNIQALDKDQNFHELLSKVQPLRYSRIPIYNETLDKIEGILYSKDLLPHLGQKPTFTWNQLLRQALFVPENRKIGALFRDFQKKRIHMAIVVDEYGGTSGLVTMEDVIEEIVGDIRDENDYEEKKYKKLDTQTYIFEAKISINDLSKALALDPNFFDHVRNECHSLGGLILEIHGNLPQTGIKIPYRGLSFTIISVHTKGIRTVRVVRPKHLRAARREQSA